MREIAIQTANPGCEKAPLLLTGPMPGPMSDAEIKRLDVSLTALASIFRCRVCQHLLRLPVALPCGGSACRNCLPAGEARQRTVSYLQGPVEVHTFTCALDECKLMHVQENVAVDVLLAKTLEFCAQRLYGRSGALARLFFPQADYLVMNEADAGEKEGGRDALVTKGLREFLVRELECEVCYSVLVDSVTTGCGHTFCRKCLARVLDHSTACPLCRHSLPSTSALPNQPANNALEQLAALLIPDLLLARQVGFRQEQIEADNSGGLDTPVFVCTLSFPRMPTFLHIFEPRYRLMMRRVMENGTRRFGMVSPNKTGAEQPIGEVLFMEHGTMLEIHNLELLPDGRSLVETVGSYRFRIAEWGERDGYMIAKTARVDDDPIEIEEEQEAREAREEAGKWAKTPTQEMVNAVKAFVDRIYAHSPQWLLGQLSSIYGEPPDEPALYPYWLASVVPIGDEEKYRLLTTTTVRDRFKIVMGWIDSVEGQPWYANAGCLVQ